MFPSERFQDLQDVVGVCGATQRFQGNLEEKNTNPKNKTTAEL
jgi:hypothetical protein